MSILEETETISVKGPEINSQATLNDIVFENRNKEYGAFVLRKEYGRYVTSAVVISSVVFFIGLVSPLIYNKYKPAEPEKIEEVVDLELMEVKDEQPEEEIPVEPPPPQVEEPPKVAMSEFLEPEVVPDEKVVKDPPKVEEIVNPGPTDQEGDPDLNEVINVGEGTGNAIVEVPVSNEPLLFVPEMPEFKGNMDEFFKKNVVYPTKALNNGIEGKVFVQFVINTDGTVTDVKTIRGIGYGCDEEAERVTKKMVWTPGKQNGVPVRIKKVLPIHFKLPD
jgi:protein TonB